jgi:hypothetical protein
VVSAAGNSAQRLRASPQPLLEEAIIKDQELAKELSRLGALELTRKTQRNALSPEDQMRSYSEGVSETLKLSNAKTENAYRVAKLAGGALSRRMSCRSSSEIGGRPGRDL